MVNETKTSAEYKTPKCRVVELNLVSCINQTSFNPVEKAEEDEYGDY